MATIDEHPESYGWWINELESLGMADAKRSNELDNDNNDNKAELKDLAENTKEMMYQQYEIAYGKQVHNSDIQKKQDKNKIV
jgi:copper oxidase (laccase) domain-containing protein